MELSKIYDPKNVESKWYKVWQEQKLFKPNNNYNDTFTIMIPPPNVTGILHMGHVLNNTIQDILIRKQRMNSNSTLWLPGMDHASIATEAKVSVEQAAAAVDAVNIEQLSNPGPGLPDPSGQTTWLVSDAYLHNTMDPTTFAFDTDFLPYRKAKDLKVMLGSKN